MLPMFTSMRDFDSWLASFRPSIADYKYYTDFNKVFNNVDAIKNSAQYSKLSYWFEEY